MSVYNFFKTQISKTLFYIEKSEGYTWIRTNPLFFSQKRLDLILSKQNTRNTKNNNSKPRAKLRGLKRAGPERLEAALKLNRINNFGYYDKTQKEFVYTNTVKNEIDSLFNEYCARTMKERIVLSDIKPSPVWAQDLTLPYKTRFTSQQRQQENLYNFRNIYKKASSQHLKGVFLTLTSNPNGGSLWEINQNTIKAWKSMADFLSKALPERAKWIKVNEFQQNGMLHYHIIIFGVNWITHKSVIQYAWVKYGGGRILDIHTIKNDPLYGWQWARSRPEEATSGKVSDLLMAYLEKSMNRKTGAMYWVTGIRSWTCSGNIIPKKQKQENPGSLQPHSKYVRKGVVNVLTGFRSCHHEAAMKYFDVQTGKDLQSVQKSPKPSIKETYYTKFAQASTLNYLKSIRGV